MKPETEAWLDFAAEDLRVARLVLDAGMQGPACFHSQQCAEKALKALLEELASVEKTHRLPELLIRVESVRAVPDHLRPCIDHLDGFYIPTRYPLLVGPLGPAMPDPERAARALAEARTVLEWVATVLARSTEVT